MSPVFVRLAIPAATHPLVVHIPACKPLHQRSSASIGGFIPFPSSFISIRVHPCASVVDSSSATPVALCFFMFLVAIVPPYHGQAIPTGTTPVFSARKGPMTCPKKTSNFSRPPSPGPQKYTVPDTPKKRHPSWRCQKQRKRKTNPKRLFRGTPVFPEHQPQSAMPLDPHQTGQGHALREARIVTVCRISTCRVEAATATPTIRLPHPTCYNGSSSVAGTIRRQHGNGSCPEATREERAST